MRLLFIKITQFYVKILSILIVYMNESNSDCPLIVEVGFHVAKQGDGRREGRIRIVSGIILPAKSRPSRG